jgi:uncharacterized membrane protein
MTRQSLFEASHPDGPASAQAEASASVRIPTNPTKHARMLLILGWGGLCGLIVAPPLLGGAHPALAAAIYLFFAPVCHQQPDRCFHIAGYALAVCHRCSGIYLGLFLGSLLPLTGSRWLAPGTRRRILVLAGCAPLLLDFALSYLGIRANSPLSRFATGFIFASVLAALLRSGVEELLEGRSWKATRFQASAIKGGTS